MSRADLNDIYAAMIALVIVLAGLGAIVWALLHALAWLANALWNLSLGLLTATPN